MSALPGREVADDRESTPSRPAAAEIGAVGAVEEEAGDTPPVEERHLGAEEEEEVVVVVVVVEAAKEEEEGWEVEERRPRPSRAAHPVRYSGITRHTSNTEYGIGV